VAAGVHSKSLISGVCEQRKTLGAIVHSPEADVLAYVAMRMDGDTDVFDLCVPSESVDPLLDAEADFALNVASKQS
jgi:hypothetical protein